MNSPEEKGLLTELNCLSSKRLIWIGSGQNEEDSGVDRELSRKVVLAIAALDSQKDEPITLIINCSGGDCLDGIAIYDAIAMCRSLVRGVVVGGACSAAAVFLQACDERYISNNSYLMIHDGQLSIPEEKVADAKVTMEVFTKWTKVYRQLLNSKSKIKSRDLDRMMKKDTWLSAEESLELGLVDKITETWGDVL